MTIVSPIPCNVTSIVSAIGGMAFGVMLVVTMVIVINVVDNLTIVTILVVIVTTIMGINIGGSIIATDTQQCLNVVHCLLFGHLQFVLSD